MEMMRRAIIAVCIVACMGVNSGRGGTEVDIMEKTWPTGAGGDVQVPAFVELTEEIGKRGGDIRKAKLPDESPADDVRVSGCDEEKGAAPMPKIVTVEVSAGKADIQRCSGR